MLFVRRRISIFALCVAWLFANGAVWNAVQVVGWAKMFHDYSAIMPAAKALEVTFNGTAPCNLCTISQAAEDTARQQMPRDAELGASTGKLLLIADAVPVYAVAVPEVSWPGTGHNAGLIRTESVPVRPPRV